MAKSAMQIWTRLPKMALLIGAAALALLASDALGCPTCKDGIAESDPAARQMAAGYFYSILFMMSMPFAILGTFGVVAYRSVRRAQATQVAEATADADGAE